jgi:AraC-like DNA-binding protein
MPIKQIAVACGYPDAHYFTTLFRRKTGQTPGAYREAGGTKFLPRRKAGRNV